MTCAAKRTGSLGEPSADGSDADGELTKTQLVMDLPPANDGPLLRLHGSCFIVGGAERRAVWPQTARASA